MSFFKSRRNSILFLILIVILIVPQTRTPIQVAIHKLKSKIFSASVIDKNEQERLADYNWKLKDQEGNLYDLKTAEGKVVFINFWATWCPPCIAEMPSLQSLYNAYDGKMEILFVTNDNEGQISRFIKRKGFDFKVYNPASDYSHLFEVPSIPRTFVIDKKGNIVIDESGAIDWFSEDVTNQLDALILE
ncbi:TlpA disulfide reductase family protein [Winogradskyella maritima]|uniref:TlpA family protein disulfide reductase n=1 Tax=Winogradskyella maritima TaxID=1517766 RepID=A0ABV8AJD8_9FLAO|nr:TlpA disulfide reductase family protein [Winogradskyella maritima]